jgi:hypothetical protein
VELDHHGVVQRFERFFVLCAQGVPWVAREAPNAETKKNVLDDTTMTLGWRKSFVFVLSWRFEDDVDDLDVDGFFPHSLQGLRRLRTSG